MTLFLGEGFIDIWAKRDGVLGWGERGPVRGRSFRTFPLSLPPTQRRRLALAGRRIMRAKQKDNSPIRGRRKSGQMGVKNSYLKMYLPSGSAVQGSRHPPGKLAVYPRFQPCVRPPPPTSLLSLLLLAALSGDVGTAVVGERATGFCKQLISPPTLPPAPCRCPPRVRVCLNTGGEGRVRGRRKPRVRFSRQPFQTFLGPLRAARGGEGGELQRKPLAELPRPLRSTRLL